MSERMINTGGVRLCTEAFGDPADAPILLIMGIGASMLGWEDDFCRRLAAGRRLVIRYDHRDTGRSVSYAPGVPGTVAPSWSLMPWACSAPTACRRPTSSASRQAGHSPRCWPPITPTASARSC